MDSQQTDTRRANAAPQVLLHGALALLLVAAALGLTLLSQGTVPLAGYIFFYAAVVGASWYGDKWSSSIAVILSVLVVGYYFTPPVHSFALHPDAVPIFLEFALTAVVIAWFSGWRRKAEAALQRARDELQVRVDERTAELRHSNEQLIAEMAERKRAEEAYYDAQAELSRVSRMSAMGTLAASISHEVNQPLAAVVTNADACAMWLASDPPNLEEARAAVDSIAREGTRAGEVTRRIRAMFTKGSAERTQVQLNDVITEVTFLLQTELSKYNATLLTDLAQDLPAVQADRIQLQQVIVNLVQNGMEAMSNVTDRPRRLIVRSARNGNGSVLVAVSDSGAGLDPKDLKRIFNAFFTTKPQGMGMGLSISHSIIESHGGRLWAANNNEGGATFQFTLPGSGGS